ncbi:DUF2235 domain-containing protein [Sulfitobacter albidus]|uniref:DUF2235 domain-containing protein n=2 Tax=Sulfitobacter albidus TaxID=2829501 RepID=A0A975PP53_9RHOB|nr:DUF2235 domain-containing protein [Sulfitobacter albidus]
MSSLAPGAETNAGLTYRLAQEMGPRISIYYEPGLQWQDWTALGGVIAGKGINRQIRRAYGYLASRFRPGDRIFLMGFSRGAYAVRSLAGIIDRVGLLRAEHATERNVRQAYRHYECGGTARAAFTRAHCATDVPIEMIGVWDTVKSLGINAPVLWRLSVARHAFHNHHLGGCVKRGYHALALDETRVVYRPVMWESDPARPDQIEQVWFRGSHGDVGGQLGGRHAARPLSNIPLVWMLARAEASGLPLPEGWAARFAQDITAPSIGTFAGWGKVFVTRRKRVVGGDPSERLHESVTGRGAKTPPQGSEFLKNSGRKI